MQQHSASIKLPQFTDLATFALQLTQAFTTWRSPRTGEDALSYFTHTPHYTGDEHELRASLIRERILPVFHYVPAQIEYESTERFDIVLRSIHQQNSRRIAIIETKSSSVRHLAAIQKRGETPLQQLERYLSQAGLYLGVLTNGDEWYLFDFALGREPLASFSLIDLATLLQGITSKEAVEQRLNSNPLLKQALMITFYHLNAQRWEQVDTFREYLTNNEYYHVASLTLPSTTETLVFNIKQVLGELRQTIRAQFALLQHRYESYQEQCTKVSALDHRSFTTVVDNTIKQVGTFGAAFQLTDATQVRTAIHALLSQLVEHYLIDGDIATFESEYLRQAHELLASHQLSQTSLLEKKAARNVRIVPPTTGLDALKGLLQTHYSYLQALDEEHYLSKKMMNAYQSWQTSVHDVFHNPQDEFCLQTAYIHFVRLFFVRVCEDYHLIPRRISDGPFARFEAYRTELLTGIKDTYLRLLEETYQRAQAVYHNFFGHNAFYDWFTLDDYTILALFDLLNRYDFQGLSADVLGRVYNEGYIEAKDRSERGQFYTPPHIVKYMLDALGIPSMEETDETKARAFLEKSVGDFSCGSGTFLVEAAARKSAIVQRLVRAREIDPEYALRLLTETFLGFDLNPFACYLAEVNLLIQCLPLLLNDSGELCRSVTRFHIYCADALAPTVAEQTRALIQGTGTDRLTLLPPRPKRHTLSDDEQAILRIKDAKGLPSEFTLLDLNQRGLDYILGNPPYVSAGESEDNLKYRNDITNFGIYHLLHQRWDLFIPFFERNLQFLRPETGKLGLIVSKGIETEGYAEKLRHLLSHSYRLLQIDFFPRLRLFQDAAVENTIVLLENRLPDDEHAVMRRKHTQADGKHYETLPDILQLEGNGQIFRWRYDRLLDKTMAEGTIPLCAIVYIGTGVEAQSKEVFDPIVHGKRQKLFTLDTVFLPLSNQSRPADYPDTGVLGNDIDRYYLRRTRYVAYEKYRAKMRRPRNIILFQTSEKLLLGETSGGYYDRSQLFANHSVQVVVPWSILERGGAIEEKGIKTVLRESQELASITTPLSPVAELFDLRYILGIINSQFMRRYIVANKLEGTREGRIYPDVWKRLPIKIASTERQLQVASLVDEIQAHYVLLSSLPTPQRVAEDSSIIYREIQSYLVRQDVRFVGDIQNTIGEKPLLRDGKLILHRQPLAYLEAPTEPAILRYIELYLTQLHPELQGYSWAEARRRIQIPATIAALHTFMAAIDAIATQEAQIRASIASLLTQVEALVENIYQEAADEERLAIIKKQKEQRNGNGLALF